MTPIELFHEARLHEAIAAQSEIVQAQPADWSERFLLAQMLGYTGDRDSVRRHLDQLEAAKPELSDYWTEWRTLLAADDRRHQGERPNVIIDPPPSLLKRLDAVDHFKVGQQEMAVDLLDEADEATGWFDGFVDGRSFDGWRDSDDLIGPVLEVFAEERYYWVPIEQIGKLRLDEVDTLRDVLYRPCKLWLIDHSLRDVFIPSLYVDTAEHPEEGIKTGAGIDWVERQGLMRGLGSRTFLFGEEELPIAEFRQVERGR